MAFFEDASLHTFLDRAIRLLQAYPAHLRELVWAVVAPEVAQHLDFEKAVQLKRDFDLPDWRRRESDLLFHVPFRVGEGESAALVCVMVEHQSTADPAMALRTLWYAVLYWERLWREWLACHERGVPLRLHPVLPIVLHTGPRSWSGPKTLRAILGGPEILHPFVPDWQPLFWDLAEHSPEELLNREGDWLPALAVVRAERAETDVFLHVLGAVLRRLEPLRRQEETRWRELLRMLLSFTVASRPLPEHQVAYATILDSQQAADTRQEIERMAQNVFQSAAQEWLARGIELGKEQGIAVGKEQGIAVGKEQGIAVGKEEGELHALRTALRELLTERFGELPEAVVQRIDACQESQRLRTALRQVLHINKTEELTL